MIPMLPSPSSLLCAHRFGTMPAQMKSFFDATGGLWVKGSLVGKGASIFTSSGTQVRMGYVRLTQCLEIT